ncbi:ATP-binding cassette domain-containing protein [Desulfopila sp. IMCC35008]|uniref:ATP-binding cassette domain-containing protein n=1 Tax=Desulfopila sp. IMCC35008 TaxID=2653858 RepID=UPI0013CF8168|nr:ATP-binding cassette domain-containing protein [Desulfopila sp. IMCC35008]
MLLRNVRHPLLSVNTFTARIGEFWCLYGTGKSGINEFLELITGRLQPEQAEQIVLPVAPSEISFAEQQNIFEAEIEKDDTDFMDRIDPGTPASEFLPQTRLSDPLISQFDMYNQLQSGYRQLSSGQARKLLLLRALLGDTPTIILDSPYDGLDTSSCEELNHIFSQVPKNKYCILVLVRNRDDIPTWCSHLAVFKERTIRLQGTLSGTLEQLSKLANDESRLLTNDKVCHSPATNLPKELITLQNGFVHYGSDKIFSGLNLTVRPGDHTLITGPNGCGKSSLLQMLTGDNPKCYANDLHIFGIRRGSGESIWDIKKRMGIVSADLHRNYRVPGSLLQVVLSGYFDSIGLYDKVTPQQKKKAYEWLASIHLENLKDTPFRKLPYGDQRLVLIARALIKNPPLLILDEPTQGLDDTARMSLLDYLERISGNTLSTILYVSHRQDEYRSFFQQHIRLEQFADSKGSKQ